MHVTYLVVTALSAVMVGYAAVLSLSGAGSVKAVAGRLHISEQWMRPFGGILAAGSVGLLAGLVVPVLGALAALGLVLYFICAVTAHLLARDAQVGGAVFFLVLSAVSLAGDFADRGHW